MKIEGDIVDEILVIGGNAPSYEHTESRTLTLPATSNARPADVTYTANAVHSLSLRMRITKAPFYADQLAAFCTPRDTEVSTSRHVLQVL